MGLNKKLEAGFGQGGGLTDSWLGFMFFFRRFKKHFFLVWFMFFLTTSIYALSIGKQLKSSLEFIFNSFIKYYVLEVQFLVPAIYLGLDRGL